jgi:hypothetical protein
VAWLINQVDLVGKVLEVIIGIIGYRFEESKRKLQDLF